VIRGHNIEILIMQTFCTKNKTPAAVTAGLKVKQ